MSDQTLREARARRDEAWARVQGEVTALRTGLAERPIPTRIKEAAMDRALDAVDEVKAVARDNVPIISGTLALLAAWFFRRPLIALIKNRLAPAAQADEDEA